MRGFIFCNYCGQIRLPYQRDQTRQTGRPLRRLQRGADRHHGSDAMRQIQQKISCGSHKCFNGRRAGSESKCPVCRYLHSIAKPIDTLRPTMLGNCESDGCGDPAVTEDYDDGLGQDSVMRQSCRCCPLVAQSSTIQRSRQRGSGETIMTDSSKPLTFMSIRLVDMGVVWFCSYCYYAPADKVIKHKDCIYVGICRDCDMERMAVKGDFA